MTEALRAELEKNGGKNLTAIIRKAVAKAKGGDFRFVKEVLDRIDGKVLERLDITSGDEPLNTFGDLSPELQAAINKERGGPEESDDKD